MCFLASSEFCAMASCKTRTSLSFAVCRKIIGIFTLAAVSAPQASSFTEACTPPAVAKDSERTGSAARLRAILPLCEPNSNKVKLNKPANQST